MQPERTELNEVAITTMEEDSPRPAKRQRTSTASLEPDLLTPPNGPEEAKQLATDPTVEEDEDSNLLSHATNVLAVEAAALAAITTLYRTHTVAKQGLLAAVKAILSCCHRERGKLVVTGVGKSGYIAQKLVATCKSLGIRASWMHACEAAHGDLGDIRDVRSMPYLLPPLVP